MNVELKSSLFQLERDPFVDQFDKITPNIILHTNCSLSLNSVLYYCFILALFYIPCFMSCL